MFSLHDTELIQVMRGGHIDCVHRGRAVVVNSEGKIVFETGDCHQPTFMRSVAKPFQTVALIESGAVEKFNLDDRELAIASGSHSGTPEHVSIVRGMLDKIGANITE
jgi:L-asparaginase II